MNQKFYQLLLFEMNCNYLVVQVFIIKKSSSSSMYEYSYFFFNIIFMFESMILVQEALEEATEASFNAFNCSLEYVKKAPF